MSASQSNLSAYGYDIVVATTQASLNTTLKEYLSANTQPEAVICYVADENGNPKLIDYAELLKEASGSDPFAVPDGANPATTPDLQNLFKARFLAGFKARLGLPPGYAPDQVPDVVTLGANTSTVTYNLMCSEFVVVEYTPASGYSPAQWTRTSQEDGKAWLFSSRVNLSLTPTSEFGSLPKDVQTQIKNVGGGAFSVQQLLFDLDSAALESLPTISGVEPGSNALAVLQKDFVGAYFAAMKKNSSPVLCCTVTQSTARASTLTLTDLNFWSSPVVGSNGQPVLSPTPAQQSLYTLNYLCAAGDALPGARAFTWNWVEVNEEAQFDGVVSISRNTLMTYLKSQLDTGVPTHCIGCGVQVQTQDLGTEITWTPYLTPGQTPTVTMPPTGPLVLSYAYTSPTAYDQAGLGGSAAHMSLSSSYTVDVTFAGGAITVTQHLVIATELYSFPTTISGNILDRTVTDTYTLVIDQYGALNTTVASTTADNSQNLAAGEVANFFSQVNGVATFLENYVRNYGPTDLQGSPLDLRDFVFPGGNTFVFKDVAFSDNQDLVAHITYTEPS